MRVNKDATLIAYRLFLVTQNLLNCVLQGPLILIFSLGSPLERPYV